MGMKAPVTGGSGEAREVAPPGKYMGICNAVFMLGTQPAFDASQAPKQKVMLGFELHKRKGPALNGAGRPYEVNAIMTNTANIKSTLIKVYASALEGSPYTEEDLEKIRAEGGFDVEELLGKCCWIDVINEKKADGTINDKIANVSALDPEDDKAPEGLTDEVYWDWTLGVECPKRIAFFWNRAAENPDRKSEVPGAPVPISAFPPIPSTFEPIHANPSKAPF
jgi:hypothetical protein